MSWLLPRSSVTWFTVRVLSAEPPPVRPKVPPAMVIRLFAAMRCGLSTALRPKLLSNRMPCARRMPAVLAIEPPSRSSSVPPRTTVVPA